MKKVLHYKTNFLNKSETFIHRLIQNHDRYHPVAMCYRKKCFTENLSVLEVPSKGIQSWLNFVAFHTNRPLPFYKKILNKEQPDLIHAHFGYDGFKMMRLAETLNIPLLVSFYGSDVSRLPSELGWKHRYKKLAANATHFIAATKFMKSQLVALGFPEEKISIVQFGVELNGSILKEDSPPNHKIMMVGRMVEKKGFEHGIRAISKLREKGIKPDVDIYGYGPQMDMLKDLSKNNHIEDQVFFHGYQPIHKVFEAFHRHSLMLAPCVTAEDGDMEGLPNTILEAMSIGTPVVATRHAAIPELIEDKKTGFLVAEKDVDGLADIIEKIIRGDFDLNKIRRNARKMIEENYSIELMVHKVENIYDMITD